jgi:hypothetical protein
MARNHDVVVARDHRLPLDAWLSSLAERQDLPRAAVQSLARRAGRDLDEFLASWQVKTVSDRERFWSSLEPEADDQQLREVAVLAIADYSPAAVAASLSKLGERIVPTLSCLVPAAEWPCVLFVAGSLADFGSIGEEAASWAIRAPELPTAVALSAAVWSEFLATASESRTKAILKEGEVHTPTLDPQAVESALREYGAPEAVVAALVANQADEVLVKAAVAAVRATGTPPVSETEYGRARSAAEAFLLEFLDSLPETAGKFELNGTLDFEFGPRSVEVDLLCRSLGVAIELDGYFHFLDPERYRRDRAKDWELQRRGFLVLRFLAEDVIPQLEQIRDRILDAVTMNRSGGNP